jgi:SynChlorMet cassette radical SAM/SPASM protein ScmF
VKLTGGEPLIHPRILDLLKYISRQEILLHVETNGVKCSSNVAQAIGACKEAAVSVSLDGVDAETHEWMRGVEGCFEKTVKGIRNLVQEGVRPQIIMTVVRRNENQIQRMVHMADSIGASSVKLNLVQRIARGESLYESGEAIDVARAVALGRWVDMKLAPSATIPVFYDYPMAFRPFSRMFGLEGEGCSRCQIMNIFGVLSDGSYALCGIGETISDLVFGNAQEHPLETVWNDHPVLKELRDGMPHRLEGVCKDCVMKHLCLGSCVAQSFVRSKRLWAPNWFCEEAKSIGIFPLSRLSYSDQYGKGYVKLPRKGSKPVKI